jgi:hypothetical protein
MTCIIAKIRWDGTARKNVLLPLSGESFNPCRNYLGITCLLRFARRKMGILCVHILHQFRYSGCRGFKLSSWYQSPSTTRFICHISLCPAFSAVQKASVHLIAFCDMSRIFSLCERSSVTAWANICSSRSVSTPVLL